LTLTADSIDARRLNLPLNPQRAVMLGAYATAIVFCIAVQNYWMGVPAFALAAMLISTDPEPRLRRRMGMLLVCVGILAVADINTDLSNANFLRVGIPFATVIVLPGIVLGRTDPGVIRYRFWPRKFRWLDILYVVISIPLAWAILKFYWMVTPAQPLQWTLPELPDREQVQRLFVGINMVGIWDELFFVNVSFAVTRSLFGFKLSNAVQAVLYTAVLNDMAFIGAGPFIVYFFAWTQGTMFEESDNLLYVLLVHLIVDAFLVAAIIGCYYPGHSFDYLWLH